MSLAVALAVVAVTVEPARACSCVPPGPWSFLRQADGAFVGRLVNRREADQGQVVLVFSVDRAVKGKIGATVEVTTANNGAACGIETTVGQRIGLFLERQSGGWMGSLCSQVAPEELLAAALLPAPNGRGPVAMLVGGRFGPARTLALDARGRTLAYGMGGREPLGYSVCPGGRRVAAIVSLERGHPVVVIRELPALRFIRRQRLAPRLSDDPFRCMSPSGDHLVVFSSRSGGNERARLARITPTTWTTLWRGWGPYASFTDRHAYIQARADSGERLVSVDLRAGTVKKLGTVPVRGMQRLVPNQAGTRLAGAAYVDGGRTRLLVIDLEQRPISVRAIFHPTAFGSIRWIRDDGFAVFGEGPYSDREILVYSAALRLSARASGWKTEYPPALVGSTAYGLSLAGDLQAAKLPSGPVRPVRPLPGVPVLIVSATR